MIWREYFFNQGVTKDAKNTQRPQSFVFLVLKLNPYSFGRNRKQRGIKKEVTTNTN